MEKLQVKDFKNTGIYYTWVNMKTRCYNSSVDKYNSYGKRGIKVCPQWHSFMGFYNDMGASWFKGATIERINVNGNYEPSNCKWIKFNEQYKNKQVGLFKYKGETYAEASKRLGGSRGDSVQDRVKNRRWSLEKAFSTPFKKNKKRKDGLNLSKECRERGWSKNTIFERLKRGWSIKKALSTPLQLK
jgi:transposase